jgi:hypothetical protein
VGFIQVKVRYEQRTVLELCTSPDETAYQRVVQALARPVMVSQELISDSFSPARSHFNMAMHANSCIDISYSTSECFVSTDGTGKMLQCRSARKRKAPPFQFSVNMLGVVE